MSLTVKRPTIEGMPSPAARTASTQDGAGAPQMRLDVMRSLRKHARLAAAVGGAVFLLAFLFGLMRKPAYEAESLIYIEPLASKVLSDGTSGSYDAGRYDSYFQQQMQTALRPDILASAIDSLPPFTWRRGGESMQSAVARLQKSLKVERVLTSYQLSISLVYASPEAAAAVVNAVTSAYLEQGRKDEHAVIDQRLKLLGEERQRIQQQLGEDRVEQASLGGMLGLADSSGKTASPFDAQIAGAQTQVAGAREAKDIAAAQYAAVSGAGSAALTAAAEEQIATDAGLNSMKQTISQRKALLSTQMAGLTPSNPIYKQDQDEIADLDRSLDAMTQQIREKAERRLQDKLRGDLQRTADIEGRLNAELRHQTATATSSVPKLQRAQDLNADIQRLTARFTVVDDAMRSLELESNGPGSAHLSVPASVPVSPNPSKRKLILALSLPLGCFVGLFAAVFANRLDPRIYSAPDVEHVLGFSPIGVLPARSEVTGRTMEEYTLRLAAGLQSAYRTSSAQSFVFTAASSTMQTSEFVQEIARILGTLGFKALVMDASSVLNAANRTQPAGPRAGYRSASLVRTIEGTRHGFAAEELERLKLKYDLLLIDAPPLLTSAETEYLVRCADATILIAESGVTVKTELYQSALLLQHLNVAGVGAVLQELHLKDAEPAFRAAIEAVERLQRGRADRLDHREQPEAERLVAEQDGTGEQAAEEAPAPAPQPERASALDAMRPSVAAEPVTLPAEAEPLSTPANGLEPTTGSPEQAAVEPLHDVQQEPVEEREQVRPWRELLKRKPEPAEEPEPAVTPVAPKRTEPVRVEEAEPVIYFQDRLRPRKPVESEAAPSLWRNERELAQVEPTPVRVEQVQADPSTSMEAIEMEAPGPLAVAMPWSQAEETRRMPAATEVAESPKPSVEAVTELTPTAEIGVKPETFERTIFESGTESRGPLVAEPVVDNDVPTPVVAAPVETESVMQAPMAEVEDMPGAATEAEQARGVKPVVEAVDPAAQLAAPSVRREPAVPKMGWFTLKFRGTSERVLRIIPGEEGEEYEPAEAPVGAAPLTPAAEIDARSVAAAPIAEVAHGGEELQSEASGVMAVQAATAEVTDTKLAETVAPGEVVHDLPAHEESPGSADRYQVGVDQETEVAAEAQALEYVDAVKDEESLRLTRQVRGDGAEEVGPLDPYVEGARTEKMEEPVAAATWEQDESMYSDPLAGEAIDQLARVHPVNEEPVEEVVSGAEWKPEPEAQTEMHTPVKLRWTVRDLHHEELEQELHGLEAGDSATTGAVEAPVPPAATLMSELRSRAAARPAYEESLELKRPSGRRSGAPVEERLEPRAAGLTRRWEMLSRFDATHTEGEAETPKAGS